MSLVNSYSDEEFSQIVSNSCSWRDLTRNLGYNCNSGDLKSVIQKRVEELNLDISHFKIVGKSCIERTPENIFIENSTANQSTLRRWYKKGEYSKYVCSICGQLPYWNNQSLTLVLDHINGNNQDDRLENLRWVCPNCNIQLPTTNRRKNVNNKKYYCIDCGKEVSSPLSKRCSACDGKNKRIPLDQMPVTREELKSLIRNTPFTEIGRSFGLTDAAIRKWCDKFNLPRKVSDIKKYSDEEWEKI